MDNGGCWLNWFIRFLAQIKKCTEKHGSSPCWKVQGSLNTAWSRREHVSSGLYMLLHLVCKQRSKVVKPRWGNRLRQVQENWNLTQVCLFCSFSNFHAFPGSRSHGVPSFWNTLSSLIHLDNCCSPLRSWPWLASFPPGSRVFHSILHFTFQSMYCLFLCLSLMDTWKEGTMSFIAAASAARNWHIVGTKKNLMN